ncbi:MAG TPA: hypothetical protein VK481_01910 [Gemmatimonadaceae bacterium]|nr:hypothetical protein [Gemmatimonadaceae bacterium]
MRSPVQGIGSHWDEWFRHEASTSDCEAIEAIGNSRFEQRRFVTWLARRWAGEANWHGEAPPIRYALAQLSRVSPFDKWPAFDRYRNAYGAPGISAIVIDEASAGEPNDVRRVEALILPPDEDATAHDVISEGFQAESADLSAARKAAMSLLGGKGLFVFLALWLATGRRPYPRWLGIGLLAAWLVVAGLIIRLVAGSDPGARLTPLFGLLFGIWASLVLTALTGAGTLGFRAWQAGHDWRRRLETYQTRLRINGGLSLQGGSAGLAFCLNTLLATYRSHPRLRGQSWLWERFFRNLRLASGNWAATGILTSQGGVESVAIEPKIRACLRHPEITDILTPWQPEARQSVIDELTLTSGRATRARPVAAEMTPAFASERRRVRSHRCRHAAQSILAVGDLASKYQLAANALAIAVSVVMVMALPDIRDVLMPPPPPRVVTPSSPSPYYLWISLDTKRPQAFAVTFESGFWANRRADVVSHTGPSGSVRAEMRLTRLSQQETVDEENGTVSVERRQKFLTREFQSGERVGSYSLSYLAQLGNE